MDIVDIIELKSKDTVRELLVEFNDVFNPPLRDRVFDFDHYSEKLVSKGHVFVAKLDTESIGFIAFYSNDTIDNVGFLSQIAVKKTCAVHNLAYRLILFFESESKKHGMKELKLEVVNNNKHAIRFYKRNGYQMANKASDDSSYMIKSIE